MKKTLIIDSNNLLYRIFYVNRARNTDVNLMYMFLNCIKSYTKMIGGADNIIAVWDSRLCRGQPNFRRVAKETDYKGNRDKEGLEEAHILDDQIQAAIQYLGGLNMFPYRMEADDVIAWLTHKQKDREYTIVTVDKDMYQLINENVCIFSPIKKIMVNKTNFSQVAGVNLDQFLQYKALVGDKSDNIPGIPRVGHKTAHKLLKHGIEKTLSKEHLEIYNKNIQLMDLSYGYNVHDGETESYQHQYDKLSECCMDIKKFKQACLHNAVYQIANNVNDWVEPFNPSKEKVPNVVNLIKSLNITNT